MCHSKLIKENAIGGSKSEESYFGSFHGFALLLDGLGVFADGEYDSLGFSDPCLRLCSCHSQTEGLMKETIRKDE